MGSTGHLSVPVVDMLSPWLYAKLLDLNVFASTPAPMPLCAGSLRRIKPRDWTTAQPVHPIATGLSTCLMRPASQPQLFRSAGAVIDVRYLHHLIFVSHVFGCLWSGSSAVFIRLLLFAYLV